MRTIESATITEAVAAAWNDAPDERLRLVLQRLTHHLHAFVRDVQPTQEEWLAAVTFLWQCGRISDDKRNEFALLSDVTGVTSLVDLLNAVPGATIGSVLGPFYADDSPQVAIGADLVKDNEGDAVMLCGTVRDTDGNPIPGAVVDMWQTDTRGAYATQDEAQPDDNLRCRQTCDGEGRYAFTTVEPGPYTIPMDGPVGALFRATSRSPWRPAHYHFIVRADGYRSIVTELFFDHDRHVDSDAVFGVREPLVRSIEAMSPDEPVPVEMERRPGRRVDFDFTLVKRQD
jgi:hydroxyquinol 1,2-dioxygenase